MGSQRMGEGGGYAVRSTQYAVPSTQYPVLSCLLRAARYCVPRTPYWVLRTAYSVPGTERPLTPEPLSPRGRGEDQRLGTGRFLRIPSEVIRTRAPQEFPKE